jgi:endogenous inhibitor of DNA gyrase (YacG/DUF329 family)
LACMLAGGMAGSVWSQAPSREFCSMHQAGIRLGGWANMGETPVKSQTDAGGASYDIDFKGGCFYSEAYVGFRFAPQFVGELSLGIFNRGEVSVTDGGDQFFGNLVVYPFMARLRIYPLPSAGWRLQPYLTGGVAFYYARHNVQFYRTNELFVVLDETSATDFDLTAGGGCDIPIAQKLALDFNVAYMPLAFSKDLITIRNYDGLSITVGIKYLFSSMK